MRLYIVTLFNPSSLSEHLVKIFSSKEKLDRWMEIARVMDRELWGDSQRDITNSYKVKQVDLDNLDFIELYAEVQQLGAIPKNIQNK